MHSNGRDDPSPQERERINARLDELIEETPWIKRALELVDRDDRRADALPGQRASEPASSETQNGA